MKRLFAVIMCLAVTLSLVACSNGETKGQTGTTQSDGYEAVAKQYIDAVVAGDVATLQQIMPYDDNGEKAQRAAKEFSAIKNATLTGYKVVRAENEDAEFIREFNLEEGPLKGEVTEAKELEVRFDWEFNLNGQTKTSSEDDDLTAVKIDGKWYITED